MGSVGALPWLEEQDPPEGRTWITHELTPAESRILELVALGLSSREIAHRMAVTRQAVTWHIGNLFMKLGADNRAGLVARAYTAGLIAPESWPPRVSHGFRLVGVDSEATE
jgi:DNA-binding CsgD family transcriptional regulator